MKIRFYLLLIAFFTLTPSTSISQQLFKRTSIKGSIGTIISTDSTTPFLLRSNQYGLVPAKSGIGFFNINLNQEYDSLYTLNKKLKRFGYGYGLEVHTNFGKTNQLLLPLAFAKIRYGAFEIYGGRRREIQGLVDTLGTMGSYIWSGNALPMPKVEISIPNYTPIMKNGLIAIKGNFAHGWFGKGDSVQNVWLHQKSFYARIGKPAWKVHLFGGFNHQVQWGGYPTKPFYDSLSLQMVERFSSNFLTFTRVTTGVSLNNTGQGLNSGSPANEALNRAGNHLGSLDIAISIILNKYRISLYRQSFYEDGSLFYLNNIRDGLYGLSVYSDAEILNKITLEYLETTNQGGSVFAWTPQLRGRDHYFNNSIYLDGWTYRGQTIGSAMLTADKIKNLNNVKSNYKILNNRVKAVHLNVFYTLFQIKSRTQLISSNNLGTYDVPLSRSQISFQQNLEKIIGRYMIGLNLAGDVGEFWNKNLGTRLSINFKLN